MSLLMRKLLGGVLRDVENGGEGGQSSGGGNAGGEGGQGGAGGNEGKGAEGGKGDEGKGAEGGKKGPTDEEARLLREVMSTKDKLKKAEEAAAQATERLKQFDGIDAEEVKKLLGERKDAETKQLEAKGEWDRLKQRMADEHASESQKLKDRIAELEGSLGKERKTINELSIGNQFNSSKFINEELTLTPAKARVVYGDHFDVVDGKVVGYDAPRGAANRTAYVNASGEPLPFEDVLKKVVEADPDRDALIRSKMRSGAGSESQTGSGKREESKTPLSGRDKILSGLKGLV